ncbi:NUDIX domain-containing protein, partial [Streptomyces sp. NPDC051172]|uniref:NUDIX domain-containing protein n=1 Tax=Streptomyces sp. NPDC051172 TaxID=3155796 RepID=UPI0034473C7C
DRRLAPATSPSIPTQPHARASDQACSKMAMTLWIPGGRLAKGEGLVHCAVRHVRQEIGLEITEPTFLGAASTNFVTSAHGTSSTHTVNLTYAATLSDTTDEPHLDEAHTAYVWWPIDRPLPHPYLRQWAHSLAHLTTPQEDRA